MQKLEATVEALEQRVASLESQLRERSTQATVSPSKANWRKLEKGMSASEVEQLLGSPSKVDVFSSFSIWSYAAGGQVKFDGRRKVDGWSEPLTN
jgi:outer membrane protein assembly factor BamE (lipoprotein component of BamABCDE complex)